MGYHTGLPHAAPSPSFPMLLSLLALHAAARPLHFPGPLRTVARERPPPVHVSELPPATPAESPPARRDRVDPARESRARRKETQARRAKPSDRPSPAIRARGQAIADAARAHLRSLPPGFRNDCSGFVMAAHHRAGIPLEGSTRSLWALAERGGWLHDGPPLPGDVAFFDDTYDRNRNGRRDDPLTHVAVVLEVGEDGQILLAHGGTSKGRTLLHMNLRYPHVHRSGDGTLRNDWLRARTRGDDGPRLAAELFRGWARFAPHAPNR